MSTIIAITKTNAGMTTNRTILKIIEVKSITKYKEFKEKKVGNRYYANTMQLYFAFRRGQCRKKKGLEINLNPLLLCFVVVGDERFELPTLYMSSRCSNQLS